MKKIILSLVMLFTLSYSAMAEYELWGNDVISAWEFEDNGNDEKGAYNLEQYGTPVYSGIIVKKGSKSFQPDSLSNYFTFPTALNQYLATLTTFTLEGWVYVSPGTGDCIWFGKRQDQGAGAFVMNWWLDDNGSTIPTMGYQRSASWINLGGRNIYNVVLKRKP